ncbi:2498_t:CDS:1, partial [Dentiscutata heterogama]
LGEPEGPGASEEPKAPGGPKEPGTCGEPKAPGGPKEPGACEKPKAPEGPAVADVFKPGVIQFHFSFSSYGEETIILGLFQLFHCKPKELSVSAGKINLNNLHEFTEALENSQIVDNGYGSPAIRLSIHSSLDAFVGEKFIVCCKQHVIASTTIKSSTDIQ